MDKSLRIKANVGKDQVVRVNMKQNVDIFEVLSLELSQQDAYKVQASNYGVIVGRILANDAFGVPNAKVSVFIPLTDEDELDNGLVSLYPYKTTTNVNNNGIRYNLLPTYSSDDCYTKVGTFPSKRAVLDNDAVLEVYDKYYKYTATTNKAGDYMIFGVPTGNTQIHVDVDLSDIGILSQKPRDFVYKGYNINQFESPTKFKSGTNLDNLTKYIHKTRQFTFIHFGVTIIQQRLPLQERTLACNMNLTRLACSLEVRSLTARTTAFLTSATLTQTLAKCLSW